MTEPSNGDDVVPENASEPGDTSTGDGTGSCSARMKSSDVTNDARPREDVDDGSTIGTDGAYD